LTVDVEILVGAERFVKSFEIKVSSLKNTDVEAKILRGESVSTVFQANKEIQTTGKVDSGKKAEGEVKFLNKTDKKIELKKNTKLTYKESNKTYNFILLDDIEIPQRSLTSTAPETFVSGEKTAEAEASSVGSSYNLAAGKSLTIEGYTSSELSAVVSASFEGGVKNTLNAPSEEDIKNISSLSFDDFKSNFVFSTNSSKIILKNSESFSLAGEKFNVGLTEPSDKLTVTQDIVVSYLTYDSDQALNFVKASMKSLIPEGYELYGKDLQIELNSLGSSEGTNYNIKESNVQLTIRSYKIPVLNEDEIKKNIAGKKIEEVSKYLDDLNVNYNIQSSSGLLNLLGFPNDLNNINVTVTRE
jgi:ribosomal protein L14E/L6E/L27E